MAEFRVRLTLQSGASSPLPLVLPRDELDALFMEVCEIVLCKTASLTMSENTLEELVLLLEAAMLWKERTQLILLSILLRLALNVIDSRGVVNLTR